MWEAAPFKIIGQLGALFTIRKTFSLSWQWLHPWRPYGMPIVLLLKEQVLGTTRSRCAGKGGGIQVQSPDRGPTSPWMPTWLSHPPDRLSPLQHTAQYCHATGVLSPIYMSYRGVRLMQPLLLELPTAAQPLLSSSTYLWTPNFKHTNSPFPLLTPSHV